MPNVVAEQPLPNGAILRLVHGDLTEESVDAIVNAANAQLNHGGGVAGAIVRRGGHSIQTDSDEWVLRHGPAGHDHPALTSAGRLPSRYVIHAVGPVWGQHAGGERELLASCYSRSLAIAAENGLGTIAFPAISTGIYGFPREEAARVASGAIAGFLASHELPREVRLVFFSEEDAKVFLSHQAFEGGG